MSDYVDGESRKYQNKKTNKLKAQAKSIVTLVGFFHDDPEINGIFKMNKFSREIEYTKAAPWDASVKPGQLMIDEDVISLKVHIARKFKIDYSFAILMEGITYYANQNGFHPVKEYLNNLKWDGVKRCDFWLNKAAGVEIDPYTTAVSRKVICAAINRIMVPGCKYDHMLILEGKQGIGKSTLASILGGPWYAEVSLTDKDKDTIDSMRGKWIIEVDEMVCFKKDEVERLKAFITHSTDRARLAYKRNTENFPRQSIFIGTINPDGDNTYFKDQTGNRRFWPVVCGDLDLGWLREHRDQLFAEALELVRLEEPLYLESKEVQQIAFDVQDERIRVDAWIAVIRSWIAVKRMEMFEETTIADIAKGALTIEAGRLTHYDQIRIGNCMKALGFFCYRKQIGNVRHRFYVLNKDLQVPEEALLPDQNLWSGTYGQQTQMDDIK